MCVGVTDITCAMRKGTFYTPCSHRHLFLFSGSVAANSPAHPSLNQSKPDQETMPSKADSSSVDQKLPTDDPPQEKSTLVNNTVNTNINQSNPVNTGSPVQPKQVSTGYMYLPADVTTAELLCESLSDSEMEKNEINEEVFHRSGFNLAEETHENGQNALNRGPSVVQSESSLGHRTPILDHQASSNSTSLYQKTRCDSNLDEPMDNLDPSFRQHSRQGSKASSKSLNFVSDYL